MGNLIHSRSIFPPEKLNLRGRVINGFIGELDKWKYGIKFLDEDEQRRRTLEIFLLERRLANQSLPFLHDPKIALLSGTEKDDDKTAIDEALLQHLSHIIEKPSCDVSWLREIDIGPELSTMSRRCTDVGGRTPILWQWAHEACRVTSFVDIINPEETCRTKTAGVILTTLIDDLADKFHDHKAVDCVYDHILKGVSIGQLEIDKRWKEYFSLISDTWAFFRKRIEGYPKYAVFKDLLQFDLQQLFNCMNHSLLLNNHPGMTNMIEYYSYQAHNMNMIINCTIDLMIHPTFNPSELGHLRALVWQAQKLVRIANTLATWRRELQEGDFSNGVFAYAIENNFISDSEVRSIDPNTLEMHLTSLDCQEYFLMEWVKGYNLLLNLAQKYHICSVDIRHLLENLPFVLISMHLNAIGYI